MRVLVVPKWYPWPDRPVFGQFCRVQAHALAGRHDVVVLACDPVRRPPFRLYEIADGREDGVRTVRLRYRRPRLRPFALGCQILGALAVLRRLRREGWVPDVVHAHVYSAAVAAIPLARRSRAPLVVTEHFTGFERGLVTGYERRLARLAFRAADLVSPVSHDLAARLVAGFGVRADRTEVVPNAVDTAVFHPAPGAAPRAAQDPPRLLSVGSLAAKKGYRDLLTAMSLSPLRERRPRLELVGAGEERRALEAQAAELGVAVRFLGERRPADVAELMRQADLFVLASHHENLPVVLIEAQASGLPAVATAVGGVPELLDAGAGRLCAPSAPRALSGAVTTAIDDRAQFDPEAMAERARERYGSAAYAARWTDLYARLLGR